MRSGWRRWPSWCILQATFTCRWHSGENNNEDRGGNDREADYGIIPGLNLHWIWDGPQARTRDQRSGRSGSAALFARRARRPRAAAGRPTGAEKAGRFARGFVYPTAFDTDDVCAGELPARTALSQEEHRCRGADCKAAGATGRHPHPPICWKAPLAPGPLKVEERRRGD